MAKKRKVPRAGSDEESTELRTIVLEIARDPATIPADRLKAIGLYLTHWPPAGEDTPRSLADLEAAAKDVEARMAELMERQRDEPEE